MGFRFQRSIKVAPGIRLNLSKSGISTSLGKRGATFTFGKNGTYMNVGIPGTGLSLREKIGTTSTRSRASLKNNTFIDTSETSTTKEEFPPMSKKEFALGVVGLGLYFCFVLAIIAGVFYGLWRLLS